MKRFEVEVEGDGKIVVEVPEDGITKIYWTIPWCVDREGNPITVILDQGSYGIGVFFGEERLKENEPHAFLDVFHMTRDEKLKPDSDAPYPQIVLYPANNPDGSRLARFHDDDSLLEIEDN